jgi:hypothetical protein
MKMSISNNQTGGARTANTKWRSRTRLIACISLISFGVLVSVGPAGASSHSIAHDSTTTEPSSSTSANGWTTYTGTEAALLPLTDPQTIETTGTIDSSGNCNIPHPQPAIPYGTVAVISETAYNPALCEATYLQGRITTSAASSLGIASAVASPAGTVAAPAAGAAVPAKVSPLNEYNSQVFSKAEYVDPVGITVTSLAENMSFNYSEPSGIIGGNSAYPVGYAWKYDIWGGANATSSIAIGDGGLDVVANGYYQHTNFDFQVILLALLGPIAVLACTQLLQTTVFTHDLFIGGAAGPEIAYSNEDSDSGGCANLTHWTAEYGSGSTT